MVRPDDEPSVRILAEVFDRQGVCDGAQHVVIRDGGRLTAEWTSTQDYCTTEFREFHRRRVVVGRGVIQDRGERLF